MNMGEPLYKCIRMHHTLVINCFSFNSKQFVNCSELHHRQITYHVPGYRKTGFCYRGTEVVMLYKMQSIVRVSERPVY